MAEKDSVKFCPSSPSNQHEADIATIVLTSDGGAQYLDINCLHCGRSGCLAGPVLITKLTEDISW